MAGGIGPWLIHWERMWEQGREAELGPRGREYIWEQHGQFFGPPIEGGYEEWDEHDFDSEGEY